METTRQDTSGVATIWKDMPRTFGPSGTDIDLLVLLPQRSRATAIARFDELQRAYDGQLDIEYKNDEDLENPILIGRKFLAYSRKEVDEETERLRKNLDRHLGLPTKVM